MADETEHPSSDEADEGDLLADLREAFSLCEYRLDGVSLSRRGMLETIGHHHSTSLATASNAIEAGSQLGDFEIIEEIGRGGMGIVYRARQVSLNREVALKVLPATAATEREVSPHRPSSSKRYGARERFRTEAQAFARLNHPNIVPVFAQGEHQDRLYFAMELVEGVSLETAIRSRPELLSSTFERGGSGPYLGQRDQGVSPSDASIPGPASDQSSAGSRAAQPPTSAHHMGFPLAQDEVDATARMSNVRVFLSASADSPSLSALQFLDDPSGAHIITAIPALLEVSLFATYDDLGLQQEDDIDGLIVFDVNSDGVFDGSDRILFSLTPGSPSLASLVGASDMGAAADVYLVAAGDESDDEEEIAGGGWELRP